jgi:Family of unknown function (DUF5675)
MGINMTVEFTLNRKEFYSDRTIGGFYDDTGKFRWYTLEDLDRKLEAGGVKVFGETAIPRGRYHVRYFYSSKRHAMVPVLLNVPQFTGVEIHLGNKPEDTEGCILIGDTYDAPNKQILASDQACSEFYPYLLEKIIESKDDCWLTIS